MSLKIFHEDSTGRGVSEKVSAVACLAVVTLIKDR